jgi:hypothetical protein
MSDGGEETPMKRHEFRRIRVIRTVDDPVRLRRNEVAFVEMPERWAAAVAAVVKLSGEHRDVGLLVTNVGPASRAVAAGIARGDVLLRCNGVSLEDVESLKRLASRTTAGGERKLTVEAVRGDQEMTFKVAAGPLGITVSPLLHRSGRLRRSAHRSARHRAHVGGGHEQPLLDESTLIEVPGHLVPQVRVLKRLIEKPANAKQRKNVEALLASAARLLPVRMAARHADAPKPPSSPPPSPASAPSSP